MSKHETWRTRKYWESVGGLLIEEFVAVRRSKNQGQRLIDGVIILGEKTSIATDKSISIENKDIIVIQTKAKRLGMGVLGQAYFSPFLLQSYKPRSIKSVIICEENDDVLKELAASHQIEIVVIPMKT